MNDSVARLNAALQDRYRIVRELGEGGMAVVYLAEDLRHERRVALKVLKPELAAVIGADRFLREIRVTAGLQHPHILPLFDSGEADGVLFYVMPFIEGESLRERLAREKRLPVPDAVRILREIADALGEAHARGVVHRDIKPANVLLSGRHALVADFGVAKAVSEATARQELTSVGMALGSPRYMAPEQASADPATDHRADLFALGVVGYEMLTGRSPFGGRTAQETLAALLTHTPEPVTDLRNDMPAELGAIVMRCLEKDPADRWQGAGDVLRELEALQTPARGLTPTGRSRPERRRRRLVLLMGTAVLAAGAGALWFGMLGNDREAWARDQALPQIQRSVEEGDLESAYGLAKRAEEVIPNDRELEEFWATYAQSATIRTEPPGARVYRRGFSIAAPWEELGTTPLVDVALPLKPSMMRFELDGHETVEGIWLGGDSARIALVPAGTLPPGMVRVPGFTTGVEGEEVELGPFLMDRYEVTNREYQVFVDSGGYERPELWEHPFVDGDRTLDWEEAMERFTDPTGRPGPATWDIGSFPEGEEDFPVGGVSWYEAAAYARFVGKELPTVHHWERAFEPDLRGYILPLSNLGGDGPAPVGEHQGMSPFGTYDMAGNVREWAFNELGDRRFLLGGGWNDPYYLANATNAQSPFDRFATNGLRLVRYLETDDALARAKLPVAPQPPPDFDAIEPVPEEVFEVYRRMFEYDPGPLDAVVERADTTPYWIRERITLDAVYGDERVPLYLHLPRGAEPPFQTVVFFPGAGARVADSVEGYTTVFDFMVRSGRAVAFPVYDGTFERRLESYPERDTNLYRDLVIHEVQDLGRSLDYLETRPEIDTDELAYYGYSWGGLRGPIMLTLEPRFDVGVLLVAGFWDIRTLPEADEVTYTPRASKPVLMLSGRYDDIFRLETMVLPMFERLGTPPEHKRHFISEGGHFVPRTELIRESLDWLDRYLGEVR